MIKQLEYKNMAVQDIRQARYNGVCIFVEKFLPANLETSA